MPLHSGTDDELDTLVVLLPNGTCASRNMTFIGCVRWACWPPGVPAHDQPFRCLRCTRGRRALTGRSRRPARRGDNRNATSFPLLEFLIRLYKPLVPTIERESAAAASAPHSPCHVDLLVGPVHDLLPLPPLTAVWPNLSQHTHHIRALGRATAALTFASAAQQRECVSSHSRTAPAYPPRLLPPAELLNSSGVNQQSLGASSTLFSAVKVGCVDAPTVWMPDADVTDATLYCGWRRVRVCMRAVRRQAPRGAGRAPLHRRRWRGAAPVRLDTNQLRLRRTGVFCPQFPCPCCLPGPPLQAFPQPNAQCFKATQPNRGFGTAESYSFAMNWMEPATPAGLALDIT